MSVAEDDRTSSASQRVLRMQGINWSRILASVGIFIVLGAIMAGYYVQNFVGLTTRDQMDTAQISLNISTGKGFTTRFIRPFNAGLMNDMSAPLPEINHGPLYPYVVAAVFKLTAVSDQAVVRTSMIFGFLTLIATFVLGRMLFDWRTGILAAVGMCISAFVLQSAMSASEWTMAGFWFVLLMLAIAAHHKSSMSGGRAGYFYVFISAILICLLYMTHQTLIFLFIPVALYFAFTGRRRIQHLVLFLVITAIAVAPWAYREAKLTGGSILGANAWDIMADTGEYPGSTLYRSMDGVGRGMTGVLLYPIEHFSSFSRKLMTGTSSALVDLLTILGLVILPLAVVSMLYKFKPPTANAVRGLLYVLAPILLVSIALYSIDHNALVLLAPMAAIYGSAYFFLLLDAKKLHPVFWRGLMIGVIAITFWPALAQIIWRAPEKYDTLREASTILSQGDKLNIGCIYTDIPWLAAWRNLHMDGVWLPLSDKDIEHLGLNGFRMHTIVLTNESRSLPADEIWYRLFTSKLQRDFIADPDAVLERVRVHSQKLGHDSEEATSIKRFFNQSQRNSEVFEALEGFRQADLGPYASDEIQVYEAGSE
ncbi:glycosyltransferase family 39 protein [bacterium]|nr:glycosyltransferase family 39 protein [bacterium]